MSVLKSKRRESQFEVFHHFYKTRKEITDLLLRDFGYDSKKAKDKVFKAFGNRGFAEMTPKEVLRFSDIEARNNAFDSWFVDNERQAVMDCLRKIGEEIFVANSIYPTCMEELIERRIHQDRAIGQCYRLMQELQYTIDILPVDINKYTRFAELIQTEINLLKGWRKADNKFKGAISDSAANFANVNNNGNANYNNASYRYGVRPDFDTVIK